MAEGNGSHKLSVRAKMLKSPKAKIIDQQSSKIIPGNKQTIIKEPSKSEPQLGLSCEKYKSQVNNEMSLRLVKVFVNPLINNLRRHLIPLITCCWCLRLFSRKREPRLTKEGITICLECIKGLDQKSLYFKGQTFPQNLAYSQEVHKVIKLNKIFGLKTFNHSELERAVFNSNSDYLDIISSLRKKFKQKLSHLQDSVGAYNNITENNDVKCHKLLSTIAAVENCKKEITSQKLSEMAKKFRGVATFKNDLEDNEDKWLIWNKYVPFDPLMVVNDKVQRKMTSSAVEMILFLYVDGQRLYSRLQYTKSSLKIQAFTSRFPYVWPCGITLICRFGYFTLPSINQVYFKICNVSKGSTVGNKFCIYLLYPDNSWQIATLFLGNRRSCYLGGEIEITDELIIFNNYMEKELLVTKDIPKEALLNHCDVAFFVKKGMVVSQITENTRKLVIYKYDKKIKTEAFAIGTVDLAIIDLLRKVPVGKHKIISCGISADLVGS